MTKSSASISTALPGVIETGCCYTMREFCGRVGWSRKEWDSARRRGLKTLKCAKRCFVLGTHAIEFFEKDAADQAKRLSQTTS